MNEIEKYHAIRHKVFFTYRYQGLDAASNLIQNSDLDLKCKVGLYAELQFYHQKKVELNLSPGLDIGDKVDFSGVLNKVITNFDVTTNAKYKSRSEFLPVMQKERRRDFQIALYDRRADQFTFLPMLFPVCKQCGKQGYYILNLNHAESGTNRECEISDNQSLYILCDNCWTLEEDKFLRFIVPLKMPAFQDDVDSLNCYSDVLFFEKQNDIILSAYTESYYFHDSYEEDLWGWVFKILWTHPLAELPLNNDNIEKDNFTILD